MRLTLFGGWLGNWWKTLHLMLNFQNILGHIITEKVGNYWKMSSVFLWTPQAICLSVWKYLPDNKHVLLISPHGFLLPTSWSLVTNLGTYLPLGFFYSIFNIDLHSLIKWGSPKAIVKRHQKTARPVQDPQKWIPMQKLKSKRQYQLIFKQNCLGHPCPAPLKYGTL